MEEIFISIPGHIVPKQRPQIAKGRAYYTEAYTRCLRTVKMHLNESLGDSPPEGAIALEIVFFGTARKYGQSDLDNLSGTIMDSLVNTGWLKNDSTKWIKKLIASFEVDTEPRTEVRIIKL